MADVECKQGESIGMLDLRSAGQFVGLMLAARIAAYLIVRLIEKIKPRPVHFIITGAIEQNGASLSNQSKMAIEANERLPLNRLRQYPELGERVLKIVRRKINYYCFYLGKIVHPRRHETNRRLLLELITKIVGLLAACISLVALVLESFFK
jgi:hypothetical protein